MENVKTQVKMYVLSGCQIIIYFLDHSNDRHTLIVRLPSQSYLANFLFNSIFYGYDLGRRVFYTHLLFRVTYTIT